MKTSQNLNISRSLSEPVLNPNFVSGFVYAEGCFMMKIMKNKKCLIGYSVQLVFKIELHKKL
jgi:hypothetical protein